MLKGRVAGKAGDVGGPGMAAVDAAAVGVERAGRVQCWMMMMMMGRRPTKRRAADRARVEPTVGRRVWLGVGQWWVNSGCISYHRRQLHYHLPSTFARHLQSPLTNQYRSRLDLLLQYYSDSFGSFGVKPSA